MQSWINKRIDAASWPRTLISIAALLAYSFWMYRPSGRFLQAKNSAGTLPEEMFGFPENEPTRAISQLFGLEGDYMLFQAIDIPYAVLNFFAFTAIFALALKSYRLSATPLRFVMLLPAVYLIAEFFENTLLVVLTRNAGESASLAHIQQAFTSLKLTAGFPSMILALLSLIALSILFLSKFIRGKSA